jgi:hypothetical protein
MATGKLALAVVLGVTVAGCGSSSAPRLDRADVAPLIALANRVAAEGPCAQKRDLAALRTRAIGLVNRHAVPPGLQEQFVAGVNDLAGRTPACAPPAPAAKPSPRKPHGHRKEHGKHKESHDG